MATLAELEQGLIKADAAGNADDARAFAAEIRRMRQQAAVPTPEESFKDKLLRNAALAGRAVGETALGLPAAFEDAVSGRMVLNALGMKAPSKQDQLKAFFDKNSYSPETKGERLMMDTVGGIYGAGMGGPAKTAGMQAINLIAGGVGGLAGGTARESGAGVVGQTGAGIVASFLTSLLGGTVRGGANVAGRVIDAAVIPRGDVRAAARIANDAAGPVKTQIINELRNGQSPIPNMPLNAGQLATPTGRAEFAGLQRIMDEFAPSPANALDNVQMAARRAEIGNVSQTPQALRAAEALRTSNANVNYPNAFNQAVRGDPTLFKLAQNPYFKDALPDAIKEAQARGINPKQNLTEFLHIVKLSLDGDLAKSGEGALKGVQKASVQDVKKDLVSWLGKKNPAYENARASFAADSKPINEMQVGQFLENKLVPPMGGSERAAAFTQATRDVPRTIKTATGQSIYDDLSQVLSPPKLQNVRNVEQSLIQNAEYENLARAGQVAARRALGEAFNPVPNVPMLKTAATVGNFFVRQLEGKGGKAATESLASMMQTNPKALADAMEKMTPKQKAGFFELLNRAALSQQYGLLGQQ